MSTLLFLEEVRHVLNTEGISTPDMRTPYNSDAETVTGEATAMEAALFALYLKYLHRCNEAFAAYALDDEQSDKSALAVVDMQSRHEVAYNLMIASLCARDVSWSKQTMRISSEGHVCERNEPSGNND